MILADTSVLSLVLRRRPEDRSAAENRVVGALERASALALVAIVGPVRQELLSGVRVQRQFDRLSAALDGFALLPLGASTWDEAARCFNRCQSHGLAATPTDMLLCAACIEHDVALLTTDGDFTRYARHLPIRLLEV